MGAGVGAGAAGVWAGGRWVRVGGLAVGVALDVEVEVRECGWRGGTGRRVAFGEADVEVAGGGWDGGWYWPVCSLY